jgi:ubiquinone/menaquinone biosynthesis C-methylase UbiE
MGKDVGEYYNREFLRETRRLHRDPYHQLEFLVTLYHLRQFLPKQGYVLDLGCGPGTYAVELGKLGYDVALVDLSEKLLRVAEKRMKKEKLGERLKAVIRASSTDLSVFEDDVFDAILCFGPLYHSTDLKDFRKTVTEMQRVSKVSARIFIAAISYFAVLGRVIVKHPHELTDPNHDEMFEKGIHRAKWHKDGSFPDAFFWKPNELQAFLESQGLKTLGLYACEGLSTHLRRETNRLAKDKRAWQKWLELLLRYSGDPSIIGSSEHFLWIGENQ